MGGEEVGEAGSRMREKGFGGGGEEVGEAGSRCRGEGKGGGRMREYKEKGEVKGDGEKVRMGRKGGSCGGRRVEGVGCGEGGKEYRFDVEKKWRNENMKKGKKTKLVEGHWPDLTVRQDDGRQGKIEVKKIGKKKEGM